MSLEEKTQTEEKFETFEEKIERLKKDPLTYKLINAGYALKLDDGSLEVTYLGRDNDGFIITEKGRITAPEQLIGLVLKNGYANLKDKRLAPQYDVY